MKKKVSTFSLISIEINAVLFQHDKYKMVSSIIEIITICNLILVVFTFSRLTNDITICSCTYSTNTTSASILPFNVLSFIIAWYHINGVIQIICNSVDYFARFCTSTYLPSRLLTSGDS